jgi:inositol-polyphosphate multikinase
MPKDIYGGPRGAIAQLAGLADWFEHQREFCFYSSSVLIIYEGAATSADAAAVSIRLVSAF